MILKFTSGNVGYRDNIYTFPYFCAFLLKEHLRETLMIMTHNEKKVTA